MKRSPVSNNLRYAFKVCCELDINGLIELSMNISKENNPEERDTWATAIASVMKRRHSSIEELRIQMN